MGKRRVGKRKTRESGGSGVKEGAVSVREGRRGRDTKPASTRSTGEDGIPDVRCRHGSGMGTSSSLPSRQSTASSSPSHILGLALDSLLLLQLPVLPANPPPSSSSPSSASTSACIIPTAYPRLFSPTAYASSSSSSIHRKALDLGVMIDDTPPSFHLIRYHPPPRLH
ncbi:hypothetical protein R3P38DRAFT_3238670 [Favolaschia claudopus]|uniref:Uncharacterized protein n=1 Tax=Favolaschia claudopus TaxID=2862362 RepID=A0AAV9Z9D4_9AGAR